MGVGEGERAEHRQTWQDQGPHMLTVLAPDAGMITTAAAMKSRRGLRLQRKTGEEDMNQTTPPQYRQAG